MGPVRTLLRVPRPHTAFGRRLRRLMDARRVSNRALARMCGVSEGAVRRWLGVSYPTLDHAVLIARALAVTLNDLAGIE